MSKTNPHMHLVTIAHVKIADRDCNAYISMNKLNDRVHVFKYCETTGICQYEVFDDHRHAQVWLEHPLPNSKPKHY